MKTLKKLFFLFLVLGSVQAVKAQSIDYAKQYDGGKLCFTIHLSNGDKNSMCASSNDYFLGNTSYYMVFVYDYKCVEIFDANGRTVTSKCLGSKPLRTSGNSIICEDDVYVISNGRVERR